MFRFRLIPAAALCLVLTGCGWLDGSYVSVTPHQSQHQELKAETMVASSYLDLMDALEQMISSGETKGVINVAGYPADSIDSGMAVAIRYATENYPIGAYAVNSIDYELGTNNGVSALAVTIRYGHSAAQIRAIQHLPDMDAAYSAIAKALENYESSTVLLVEDYLNVDLLQFIRSYAEEHPDTVMEVPQVTEAIHGTSREKVIELSFAYQTSRDSLRHMQSQVKPVFDAAALYVSGDGKEHQKFTQLYAFLMERFSYVFETSITPAYSLLHHGVGDSRAFAQVFAAMCREAGLECLTVTGTCAGEPRTWNILSDGGRYYHLDLLRCYEDQGFREMTDNEMSGYVWDYSAYPACPSVPAPAATEPAPQTTTEPQPLPEDLSPETQPTTEPAIQGTEENFANS